MDGVVSISLITPPLYSKGRLKLVSGIVRILKSDTGLVGRFLDVFSVVIIVRRFDKCPARPVMLGDYL